MSIVLFVLNKPLKRRGDPQARMPGRKGGSWCKSSAVPQL